MSNNGWIKLHRSLLEKSWYLKGDYLRLWIHLLLKATHAPFEMWFNGKGITLQPGQLVTGRKSLSRSTGICESNIERILTYFTKYEHQIEQQKTNRNRLITLINWPTYQQSEQLNEQPPDNHRTTTGQPPDTNKKIKNTENTKNIKKKDIIHSWEIDFQGGKLNTSNKRELKEIVQVYGEEKTIEAISRWKQYHKGKKLRDYTWAKRFNRFQENIETFIDENEFQDRLEMEARHHQEKKSAVLKKQHPEVLSGDYPEKVGEKMPYSVEQEYYLRTGEQPPEERRDTMEALKALRAKGAIYEMRKN